MMKRTYKIDISHIPEENIEDYIRKVSEKIKNEKKMKTPEQIKEHSSKYKYGSWKNYSYEEFAQWVNLLTMRASHRTDLLKAEKDLDDANNYLAMLNAKFNYESTRILKSFEREE